MVIENSENVKLVSEEINLISEKKSFSEEFTNAKHAVWIHFVGNILSQARQ